MSYTSNGIGYQSTETSRLAINTDHLLNVREKVLHFLRTVRVSLTTEQIAAALEIPYPSVQPRLSELKNDNLVKASGDRGETKYGKSCVKWVAVNGQA